MKKKNSKTADQQNSVYIDGSFKGLKKWVMSKKVLDLMLGRKTGFIICKDLEFSNGDSKETCYQLSARMLRISD